MLSEDEEGDHDRSESGRGASSSPPGGAEGEPLATSCLSGPGVLILLPDGRVTGSMFEGEPRPGLPKSSISGGRRQFGVHGKAVLQYRDCTRDDEWHLLLVTITDFEGGGREVQASDGSIRAPVQPCAALRSSSLLTAHYRSEPLTPRQVLCEKTEEDAARLAPYEPQGEEGGELRALLRNCARRTTLSFACDVIVTGDQVGAGHI